ncbi:hypothetical protein HQ571_02485 [Candidatus Kuenenbacteria bacterium]|nr:hypothetical protein [Candidatus Kuenenbacteria bacterium]
MKYRSEGMSFWAMIITALLMFAVIVAESMGQGPLSVYYNVSTFAYGSNVVGMFIWPLVVFYDWHMIRKKRVW